MAKSEKDTKILEIARGLKDVPWCDEYEKMVSGMMYVRAVTQFALSLLLTVTRLHTDTGTILFIRPSSKGVIKPVALRTSLTPLILAQSLMRRSLVRIS